MSAYLPIAYEPIPDALLRSDAELPSRVFECHPEGAFAGMNGGPLLTPKKVKSRPHEPGLADRRRLLADVAGFDAAFLASRPPRGAGAGAACNAWRLPRPLRLDWVHLHLT